MSAPRPSRPPAVLLAAAGALLLVAAGPTSAQSCVREGDAATRCRLLLSEPRALTIEAGADLRPVRGAPLARMAIEVDGRPCLAPQLRLRRKALQRCPVTLPAGEHVIAAGLEPQDAQARGVGVVLIPNPRLAELPREAVALDPPPPAHRAIWRRFWPF